MAYATLTELKMYLGISGNADDTLLTACLARAQAAIDAWTGRTFEALPGTRYYGAGSVDGDTLYLNGDLVSVTTLRNGDSDATLIPSDGYILLPRNARPAYAIRLRSGYAWSVDTDREITVTGEWGYSTSAPADVAQATIRLAAYMYRQKDAGVYDVTATPELGIITTPQGMPADVGILLMPYRRVL